MSRNVLIIYPQPDIKKSHRFGYSLSLLYLSTTLRDAGFEVRIVDFSVKEFEHDTFAEMVRHSDFVLLELDAFPLKRSSNFQNGVQIAHQVRYYNHNIPLIAFGKHCTLSHCPTPGFGLTIAGEPEIDLPGILTRVEHGEELPPLIDVGLIHDLNSLPSPDRGQLSREQICGKTRDRLPHLAPSALMETSRGCLGRCSFCQRKGWGQGLRTFNEDYVINEFRSLLADGIQNIWLIDDNFGANLQRSKNIMQKMARVKGARSVRIALSSWVHVDREFVDLAKHAGVSVISFGIESVDETILAFYRKRIDFSSFEEVLRRIDELGMYSVGNFILGAPQETEESFRCSLDFAIRSSLDEVNVKILDYMQGADLYDSLSAEIRVDNIHVFSSAEQGLCQFTEQQLLDMKRSFTTEFRSSRKDSRTMKIRKHGFPYFVS